MTQNKSNNRRRLADYHLVISRALCWFACALICTVAHAQSTDEPQFEVSGYEIEGALPISLERAQAVLTPYTGPAVTLSQLKDAAKALETLLSDSGFPFYRVILPAQAAENVVKLRVLTFHLANISISKHRYFSKENIAWSLPALRLGEAPNVGELARNRSLLNEHPSKNAEVNFVQGDKPDEVNAEVTVQDEPPVRFFIGLNNTGNRQTGKYRATLGLQHSNLWDRDHAVTATFTTSPDHFEDVKQYGLYYRMPFYSVGGALTLFYAYSDVSSGVIANAFQVSGRGSFAGIHWRQHLVPIGAYAHGIEAGFEDRLFENDVTFSGAQLGVNVRTRPAVLGYFGRLERIDWGLSGAAHFVRNLAGGDDSDAAAYQANRLGATRDFSALRVSLDAHWRVRPIVFTARVRAQHSSDALIPGEQFGLGGALSVRGLREREVTGDSGWFASAEAAMPLPWEGFSVALFVDGGEVHLENTVPGQPGRQHASSIGVGLRWVIARRAAASLDLAQVLDGTTVTSHSTRRAHASVVYSF